MGEWLVKLMEKMESPVLIRQHSVAGDRYLGELVLNSPATLNALSLDMINLMSPQLAQWADDARCVCVLVSGAGDRSFCAGGDIQALYKAMTTNLAAGRQVDDYPARFFEAEYRLDYQLHTFPKPVIAFGDGFIMGGGLGVFSACQYRVVTDKTRLAMPEITIGLFPDAGASQILSSLPKPVALFLGMTGSQVRAGECMYLSLATHHSNSSCEALLSELVDNPWVDSSRKVVEEVLEKLNAVLPQADSIKSIEQSLNPSDDLMHNIAEIDQLPQVDAGFERGAKAMHAGCPVSLGLVNEQIKRSPSRNIAELLQMELCVATHCAEFGDFHEGVRALIIDKDNQPQWSCGFEDKNFETRVAAHFDSPWPDNPLANLGN